MKKILIRIPITALAIFATFEYVDDRTFMTCLIMWLGYAVFCLGVTRVKEIKTIKIVK